MRRAILAGAMMAITAAALPAPASADDWTKTYAISARADLHVTTDDGDVNIVSADQRQIDVHVRTEGWRISSNEVRIEESQNGDHVTLSVKVPHWNWSLFGGRHKSVHVELRVPRELELDVHTGDGNVAAQEASGRIFIDTGDGNVTANGLKGDIHVHTGDGHIEGTDFDGMLNADTGDGRLRVGGRFDVLNLKTGDGSIEAAVMSGSKVAGGWTITTGDGHVILRMPGDLHADLDAHTGDGSITVDVPISVQGSLSQSSVRGKINGGGGELKISTGDGSIHLERL